MSCGHQRIVGSVEVGGARQDGRGDQPAPEGAPEPTLVIVASLHANRRRVEPHEQQAPWFGRQVRQRLDAQAVDHERGPVTLGSVAHWRQGTG